MEAIFEVIFIGFISNTLGVYTRYFFFKITGRKKSIKYLKGNSEDGADNAGQSFSNTIVGLFVFFMLTVGTVKIIDML